MPKQFSKYLGYFFNKIFCQELSQKSANLVTLA